MHNDPHKSWELMIFHYFWWTQSLVDTSKHDRIKSPWRSTHNLSFRIYCLRPSGATIKRTLPPHEPRTEFPYHGVFYSSSRVDMRNGFGTGPVSPTRERPHWPVSGRPGGRRNGAIRIALGVPRSVVRPVNHRSCREYVLRIVVIFFVLNTNHVYRVRALATRVRTVRDRKRYGCRFSRFVSRRPKRSRGKQRRRSVTSMMENKYYSRPQSVHALLTRTLRNCNRFLASLCPPATVVMQRIRCVPRRRHFNVATVVMRNATGPRSDRHRPRFSVPSGKK